jgi:excisionase family DNA binding protein
MTRLDAPPVPHQLGLLTVGEAASLLRLHHRTIRAMAEDGRLKKVTLGPQSVRITLASVEQLIADGMAAAS